MNITDIFKNSLNYPLTDYKKLIILGIIFVIASISSIYNSFGGNNAMLAGILVIIGFIVALIAQGYILSIIKFAIDGNDEIPDFSWKSNFVMGIKYFILSIIYFIIPFIIVFIVAWATGFFDSLATVMSNVNVTTFIDQTSMNAAMNAVPNQALDSLITSLTISTVVGVILFIIFGLFTLIGECRLADTGSLVEGLKINEVINDISAIGWAKYIIWVIVLLIIVFILSIINGLISSIPYVGLIIAALIVTSFIAMFAARALGLLYANS